MLEKIREIYMPKKIKQIYALKFKKKNNALEK